VVAKQWLAARQADLLPVPSYHVVLASNMRSVMKIADGNMISDVLDGYWLGSSAVFGATISMRQITEGWICLCPYGGAVIGPAHHARKGEERWAKLPVR